MTEPLLMTAPQAAKMLGIGYTTFAREWPALVKRKVLPEPVLIGRRYKWRRDDLENVGRVT